MCSNAGSTGSESSLSGWCECLEAWGLVMREEALAIVLRGVKR